MLATLAANCNTIQGNFFFIETNKQTNEIKVKSQRESSSREGKGRRRSKGRGLKQAGAQLRRLVSSLDNLCGILNENSQT